MNRLEVLVTGANAVSVFRAGNLSTHAIVNRAACASALFFWAFCILASAAMAEGGHSTQFEDPRGSLSRDSASGTLQDVTIPPLELEGGSSLTFVSPERWLPLARKLQVSLRRAHRDLTTVLGEIPAFQTSIRLMDNEAFYASTGAPRWTNAMYYRGQIVIPLSSSSALDQDNLARALKHEYTHAIVHALSDGRCPGWIDEGLAQWAEGEENPALQPALLRWLKNEPPVSFIYLQGGFTRLAQTMVPAAYAQALFATNTLIKTYGFPAIRKYFDNLKDGSETAAAFRAAFALSEKKYEQRLDGVLSRWAGVIGVVKN